LWLLYCIGALPASNTDDNSDDDVNVDDGIIFYHNFFASFINARYSSRWFFKMHL